MTTQIGRRPHYPKREAGVNLLTCCAFEPGGPIVQDSARKLLRLDRRLAGRRGWVSQEEIEREIAALPDVSAKADLVDAPDVTRRREEASPQGS
jgi:hypothetical protein